MLPVGVVGPLGPTAPAAPFTHVPSHPGDLRQPSAADVPRIAGVRVDAYDGAASTT